MMVIVILNIIKIKIKTINLKEIAVVIISYIVVQIIEKIKKSYVKHTSDIKNIIRSFYKFVNKNDKYTFC